MVGNITKQSKGYTLVELVVVMILTALVLTLVVFGLAGSREKTFYAKAQADLSNMGGALLLYANKYNAYPTPISKGIPASLVEFLDAPQSVDLVNAPWPSSSYAYDLSDFDADGTKETITLSVRFCPPNGDSIPTSNCKFPQQPWATGFNNYSSLFYCVKGYCRSHPSTAYNNPGYCLNCPGNTGIAVPIP
ncbi:type II secretion system protein [Pedobacter sp.]|nr:type II secretion system protein [Candidatus Saccharibacteria bacterium]